MMRFLSFVLFATAAMAQQFHIDHVTVAGKDVQAMIAVLRTSAGITAQYGGPHSNHATEMALASFADGSYLELIAIQPHADPAAVAAHYWHKFLETDGTPCAWAIRPADLDREVDRLRTAGIEITGPHNNGRKRPDGVQLEWETAQIGPTNGGFFPFMIHDFTPRGNRASPSGNPSVTTWTGITRVVIAVHDLDSAIAEYQRAYLLPSPQRQDDPAFAAHLAWFPGTPVVLAAPLSSQSWLNARLQEFGETPCAFILGPAQGSFVMVGKRSKWFGHSVFWADEKTLGWRLGFQPQ